MERDGVFVEGVRRARDEFEIDAPRLFLVLENMLPEDEESLKRFDEHEREVVVEVVDRRLEVEGVRDIEPESGARVCVVAGGVCFERHNFLVAIECVLEIIEKIHRATVAPPGRLFPRFDFHYIPRVVEFTGCWGQAMNCELR